jgi:hypothetical protein
METKKHEQVEMWRVVLKIPAFRRLRQEDLELKANLGYPMKPCPKK